MGTYAKLVKEARELYANGQQAGAPLTTVLTHDTYKTLWRAYKAANACDDVIDAYQGKGNTEKK